MQVGSYEFAKAFRAELERQSPSHPLLSRRLSRWLVDMARDGRIPAEKVQGRFVFDTEKAAMVAELIGATPQRQAA